MKKIGPSKKKKFSEAPDLKSYPRLKNIGSLIKTPLRSPQFKKIFWILGALSLAFLFCASEKVWAVNLTDKLARLVLGIPECDVNIL